MDPHVEPDPMRIKKIARQRFDREVNLASLNELASTDLISVICKLWGLPAAAKLAEAWLHDDKTNLTGVSMDTNEVEILLGAAAAAAVLVLVVLARRSACVHAYRRQVEPSPDFCALQRIRDQGGAGAEIARALIDKERSPWSFKLDASLKDLPASDKRTLLSLLVSENVGVEVVKGIPGTKFAPEYMSSSRVILDDSVWLVATETPIHKVGFSLRGTTVVPVEVDICTADWWCLTMEDLTCPIAKAVRDDPDEYVGLEEEYAPCWSVRLGFGAFAEPRMVFDEVTLAEWSERFRARLSLWYPDSPERLLSSFGAVGERFDASVMRPASGVAPVADVRVVAVQERDGRPQLGLGCLGAPPLLYAIVHVEED
jgi:hypothetical protein